MQYVFRIDGDPIARAERITRDGKRLYDVRKKEKNLIKAQLTYLHQGKSLLTGPLGLRCLFGVRIPASASKTTRVLMLAGKILPTTKPDLSNYFKLYEDCLTGTVIEDDRFIVIYEHSWKMYAENPYTILTIREIKEYDNRNEKDYLALPTENGVHPGLATSRGRRNRLPPKPVDPDAWLPPRKDVPRQNA